jgi:peptidoglycan/LPS O-acetylase OafA/YrhL
VAVSPDGARLRSLDGVRGLAAVVVVLYHAYLLAQPHLYAASGDGRAHPGNLDWWLYLSPVSILTSGEQAVLVFFMLSGIVLTLPVIRATSFNWVAYYPRRVLRLYLPVVVSVALAAAFLLAVPRTATPMPSWQWDQNAHSFGLLPAVTAAALVNPAPQINGPLWSLSWEMAFSVALPLFVLLAAWTRRWWLVLLAAAVLASDVGSAADFSPLHYLPVFLIGVLAALHIERIAGAARRLDASPRRRLIWSALLAASILFITAFKALPTLLPDRLAWVTTAAGGLVVVGCMGLVFLAMGSSGAVRVLESRPVQRLGALSFSLYLVHVPLMLATAYLLGWDRWWLAILVAVPLSFLLATAFMTLVERPAHALSKRSGRLVEAWRPSNRQPRADDDARQALPSSTAAVVPDAAVVDGVES